MFDSTSQFTEAMRAVGLTPPAHIQPGKIYRFPGADKSPNNKAGWCKLFDDGIGGVYGDHSTGLSENWQARRDTPYSQAEQEAFKRQLAEARKQREAEEQERHSEAAKKAARTLQDATPAPDDFPYLTRKGIKPNGARLHNGSLVIPMRDGGAVHSLQFIDADGGKLFLPGGRVTGCYFSIGNTKDAEALCIAEGFATGASIHESTGYPVAVAFNAGNLDSVTQAMRAKFPELRLIVCADDDYRTEGNPGLNKATAAALSVGGLVAVPDFGSDRPEGATDFNDMAQLCGKDAIQQAIASAKAPAKAEHQADDENAPEGNSNAWPEPQPMTAKIEPEPYPLDALPGTVQAAVEEVAAFVKAPLPMVASAALSALSLAIQAHTDVKRAEKLTGPVGLFLLTIADSGERKSTCDNIFTKAIRDYEEAQAEAAKPLLKDYRAALESWEAQHNGIKDKIRQLAKEKKSTADMVSALRDLEYEKPEPSRIPRLIFADATPEALTYGLAKQWPSGGIVSAEAGIVFGSHGMGKESVMRNLATLNQLWDGTSLNISRRTSESYTVRGARLTVALQVQEPTLREFFKQSGALARGTGFLARFLVAWPESTQGFRPFTEAPENWPHLAAFNRRIAAILDQPVPIDDDGALTPPMLPLTPEAKAAWITFHNAIEIELASGGELYDVRDVASKSADNAVRLAALFHMFESGGGAIGANALEAGSRIAAWHLNEARRFFGELALPPEMADAARLDRWLMEHCQREQTHFVGKRHARQHGPLRSGDSLDAAIRELSDLDRMRLLKEGKRITLQLNPALLIVGGA